MAFGGRQGQALFAATVEDGEYNVPARLRLCRHAQFNAEAPKCRVVPFGRLGLAAIGPAPDHVGQRIGVTLSAMQKAALTTATATATASGAGSTSTKNAASGLRDLMNLRVPIMVACLSLVSFTMGFLL